MDKTTVGVIGSGFIGPVHIRALRGLGYVDVVALSDVDQAASEKKAESLLIDKAYGDYRDMLADSAIQVIHICTPNFTHYQIARDAILAGKHVVCEKPLSMKLEEANELVKLAAEKKLVGAVHFNIRFYPIIRQIREMVEQGDIGRILAVNGSYQQDWLFKDTDYSWRLEPEISGASRAVADIGSHWFDTVEYVTGLRVERLCADFATFHKTRKKPLREVETYSGKMWDALEYEKVSISTEDYASVIFQMSGGAHGGCHVNQVAAGRKNRLYFELYGDRSSVAFDSERPNELWIGHRDEANKHLLRDPALVYPKAREIIALPGGHNEGFSDTSRQMFSKVYTYIRSGGISSGAKPDFPSFEDGKREQELCEAILRSVNTDKWVDGI